MTIKKLTSELIIQCYSNGIFPMSEDRKDKSVYFVNPSKRGIIPLNKMHISKSLRRAVKQKKYNITSNKSFKEVITSCASPIYGRNKTWINDEIFSIFLKLHSSKIAHSVEIWNNRKLIGGIYGLVIGGVFFAESMFSAKNNASKIALVWLVAKLRHAYFSLFDTQFKTNHLASLGCIEIENIIFNKLLTRALNIKVQFPEIDSSLDSDCKITLDFLQDMREMS